MPTTVAVTAASGKLGGAVVRAAVEMVGAARVVALARTPAKAAGLGVEVRPGDYEAPEALEASLRGVDALLLVSGMAPPEQRVVQHRNVIEAARRAGVQKIVYTSIQGAEEGTGFSPVVRSNRQTEADVRASGLAWAVGRNGIYIEPDVEYVETYKARGEIANCAGDGVCGYTTRGELAFAYARLLTDADDALAGRVYNLHGEKMSQAELAGHLNRAFRTNLAFRDMPVAAYREDRVAELGDFMGTVIAGIYEGVRAGALDNESDYAAAAGRPHQAWADYFSSLAL